MHQQSSNFDSPADAFKGCLIFESLNGAARAQLAARAVNRTLGQGAAVFRMGEPGDTLVAVVKGWVRAFVVTEAGREVVLGDFGPGSVLGEISLLDGGPRSASVAALSNCQLAVLRRTDVLDVLGTSPQFCFRIMELLCARVRRSDGRMLDLVFLEIPNRLARVILATHAARDQQGRSKLALSQSELAGMIGAARENVNRVLRHWQRDGIIELHRGWVVVADPQRLELIAHPPATD